MAYAAMETSHTKNDLHLLPLYHLLPRKLTWLAGKSPFLTGNTSSFMVHVSFFGRGITVVFFGGEGGLHVPMPHTPPPLQFPD